MITGVATLWVVSGGLVLGSFIALVIARSSALLKTGNTPAQRFPLLWPASHCPHCDTRLRWAELIPLLSALYLQGRCRTCQHPFGWRDTAVELSTLLITLCWASTGAAWPWLIFFAWLLALAWIDAQTQLLPDALTLSLLWFGLLCAALGWLPMSASSSIIGALIGYLSFWCVLQGDWLLRRRDGLGRGDLKLMAALGAWLGVFALPWVVLLGALSALLSILIRGWYRRHEPIAFGPALVFGATLYWLYTIGFEMGDQWPLLWV